MILVSPHLVLDFLRTISIPLDTLRLELFEFCKTLCSVSSLTVASAVTDSVMGQTTPLDKLKSID